MILKDFYTEKKNAIEMEFTSNAPTVQLYTDTIFKDSIETPVVMFKYDIVNWETSSEKNYKADVSFCLYIILPVETISSTSYANAFDIAQRIDKAILSKNNSNTDIDTNSTFKIREKQCTNEHTYWNKNDYFIWEITYKTTLIENILKKKYILFNNGLSNEELKELGYNLTTGVIEINPNQVKGDIDLKTSI